MILVPLFDLKSLNPIFPRVSQGLQIGGTSCATDALAVVSGGGVALFTGGAQARRPVVQKVNMRQGKRCHVQ
jgi:hypothetical protein